jgi:leucyl/phenylalanyl-tRNA---protein transferase
MRRVVFPPVESATEDGLVAVGGDLEIDTILSAYRSGIFPWPISPEFPLAWFSPNPRGILEFSEFHIPRSFEKFLKKRPFTITFNRAFDEVIRECARIYRKGQPSTWITPDIIHGYQELFKKQFAYSVEVWNDQELVAGLYGVCIGEFISGESMFTKEDNASKYALFSLVEQLQTKNIQWLDTQMVTSVVENFGGKYIPRPEFLQKLPKLNWTRKREEIFNYSED